jgi:hypothetical protein
MGDPPWCKLVLFYMKNGQNGSSSLKIMGFHKNPGNFPGRKVKNHRNFTKNADDSYDFLRIIDFCLKMSYNHCGTWKEMREDEQI